MCECVPSLMRTLRFLHSLDIVKNAAYIFLK